MSDRPTNQGVQMIPAMHVTPGQITANITAQNTPDGQKIILFHLEHSTGSTFAFLTPEVARQLGEQLIEKSTGLHLAQSEDIASIRNINDF